MPVYLLVRCSATKGKLFKRYSQTIGKLLHKKHPSLNCFIFRGFPQQIILFCLQFSTLHLQQKYNSNIIIYELTVRNFKRRNLISQMSIIYIV